MRAIANQIYPERYLEFQGMLNSLGEDVQSAPQLINQLLGNLDSKLPSPESIQATFFLKAFQRRLAEDLDGIDNLYLLPDQGQQIQMFSYMAQKFPVVRYAQDLVNQALFKALQSQAEIVIWDIGIGNGQQLVRLLAQVIKSNPSLKVISIIGLDPSQDSLKQAEQALQEVCAIEGVSFHFLGIPKVVEALVSSDWHTIEAILNTKRGQWVANASFALHHISPTELRNDLFDRIKAFQPALFCLIEPYADFLTENLALRFNHAWHHYGLSLWAIDQIDAHLEQKNLLKSVFFGREILDVIGKDTGRTEQFETGEMWVKRLHNAGFEMLIPVHLPHAIPDFPAIGIQPFERFIGFTAKEHPIISILIAH